MRMLSCAESRRDRGVSLSEFWRQSRENLCNPLRRKSMQPPPTHRASGTSCEKRTKIFCKPRKMIFLRTSPRRKPSLPRAGAHRNGLRDVKEARTSPLLPPESHRLASQLSPAAKHFAGKYGKFCGKIWYKLDCTLQARFRGLPELQRRQISVA